MALEGSGRGPWPSLRRALASVGAWAAPTAAPLPPVIERFENLTAYHARAADRARRREDGAAAESALVAAAGRQPFEINGYCCVCACPRRFLVDTQYGASDGSGGVVPNWRERQVCEACSFNSRLRAAADILLTVLAPGPDARLYAQEQVTPFFRWLHRRFPQSIGSEYLDPRLAGGSLRDGLRHEDATALSFPDASIDHVISFEVLEHVPDYAAALREMFRVLRPGGYLLLSAPFRVDLPHTLVRASVRPDGTIAHHEAAEYHGNPIDPEGGSLCFYHFGWDLLDTMRRVGATEAVLLEYTAPGRGCHGPPLVFLLARR